MQSPTLSRRHFLAASLGSALAAPLSAATDPAAGGWIDAHVHIWTPDTKAYPLAPGFKVKAMAPPSFTPEELFVHTRPAGVSRIVLVQMSFYQYDNHYMLDMMDAHHGVFGGIGIVDETKPGFTDVMQSMASRDVRGFRIYTSQKNAESWGGSMDKMWSFAADHGLAMCLLADPAALPAVHRMCSRFPKTRVVIDHFGRLGMKGEALPQEIEDLRKLAEFPHTYIKTSAFYALGKKQAPYTDMGPLVKTLRDTFGARRLMWASDCPYQVEDGHSYNASIAVIRDHLDFLTAEDKQWILRQTAESLFFS